MLQQNEGASETVLVPPSARSNDMSPTIEKRQHPRFDFQQPVKVYPVLPSKSGNIYEVQSRPVEFQAYNISEEGLALEADRDMDGEIILKMNFEVEKDQPLIVYGKIVWSQEKHLGVRFLMVDSDMRRSINALGKKQA